TRPPDPHDRSGLPAVPDRPTRPRKARTLFRPTWGEEKRGRGDRSTAVCLRARRYAVVVRRRSRPARPQEPFRHVLPGGTHADRAAQGYVYVCCPMWHERCDPGAAELSRLPEPIAKAACGTFFAHALRRLQSPRENREGRSRRQKMDRRTKL